MRITLSYQKQTLPPPFAYAAVLHLETDSGNEIATDLSLEYLDRDELSEDELRAEGFTRDDDYAWKGTMHKHWIQDVESMKKMAFSDTPDPETYLHVQIDQVDFGFPKEIARAEMLFQELLQAILEQSSIEAPLRISLMLDDSTTDIVWNFASRTLAIDKQVSERWEIGRKLLKSIYAIDFESLKANKKAVKNSINIGDGAWYSIHDRKKLDQIKTFIDDLSG